MTSDQTIPSILGYFAGMLYNPNNVTPEAAPVTVQWELEVGADILRMLGFQPPPKHVGPGGVKTEFGWAHVTSGGTVANLEALWARATSGTSRSPFATPAFATVFRSSCVCRMTQRTALARRLAVSLRGRVSASSPIRRCIFTADSPTPSAIALSSIARRPAAEPTNC